MTIFNINLAYWGPAQDQYLYQTLEKIAYRPVVEDCARAAARQWRQARERLIGQGLAKDNLDADQRFGGVRAANLKRLEQEEALSAAGIALDQVDLPPFQRVKDDWRAIHQFLITWHCLVMGWSRSDRSANVSSGCSGRTSEFRLIVGRQR